MTVILPDEFDHFWQADTITAGFVFDVFCWFAADQLIIILARLRK